MKFACLFAVKDIKCTRAFYEELFNLKVIDDFGRNIVLIADWHFSKILIG